MNSDDTSLHKYGKRSVTVAASGSRDRVEDDDEEEINEHGERVCQECKSADPDEYGVADTYDSGEWVCSECASERETARRIKPPEKYSPRFMENLRAAGFVTEREASPPTPVATLAAKVIQALGRDASVPAIARCIDAALAREREQFHNRIEQLEERLR